MKKEMTKILYATIAFVLLDILRKTIPRLSDQTVI